MLKRIRMFYDLTITKDVSEFIFYSLEEESKKTKNVDVRVFYLGEEKPGLKDICIRIEGKRISEVKKSFDNFVNIANLFLKEASNDALTKQNS